MQIFNNFYLKPEFHCKVLKFRFKAFYSDQAFWDFLDTCSTFFAICKKKDLLIKVLSFQV